MGADRDTGFRGASGAPVPDYIIPAQFFDPSGDEIRYRNTIDIFTIATGEMPTNGTDALLLDHSTAINSPTNFAGVAGTVVAAPAVPGVGLGAGIAIVMGAVGLAAIARQTRRALPRPARGP